MVFSIAIFLGIVVSVDGGIKKGDDVSLNYRLYGNSFNCDNACRRNLGCPSCCPRTCCYKNGDWKERGWDCTSKLQNTTPAKFVHHHKSRRGDPTTCAEALELYVRKNEIKGTFLAEDDELQNSVMFEKALMYRIRGKRVIGSSDLDYTSFSDFLKNWATSSDLTKFIPTNFDTKTTQGQVLNLVAGAIVAKVGRATEYWFRALASDPSEQRDFYRTAVIGSDWELVEKQFQYENKHVTYSDNVNGTCCIGRTEKNRYLVPLVKAARAAYFFFERAFRNIDEGSWESSTWNAWKLDMETEMTSNVIEPLQQVSSNKSLLFPFTGLPTVFDETSKNGTRFQLETNSVASAFCDVNVTDAFDSTDETNPEFHLLTYAKDIFPEDFWQLIARPELWRLFDELVDEVSRYTSTLEAEFKMQEEGQPEIAIARKKLCSLKNAVDKLGNLLFGPRESQLIMPDGVTPHQGDHFQCQSIS